MKGRRVFDHVDPYLVPPEHDPPEPPETSGLPQCPTCGFLVDLYDAMDDDTPFLFGRYWPPRWSVRDEHGHELTTCPECHEWLVGREVAEGAGLPGDYPWRRPA